MRRHVLAVVVVLADAALHLPGYQLGSVVWAVPFAALVVALGYRWPVASFVAALAVTQLTGGDYVLLLWTAFWAGRSMLSRQGTAVVAGAALGAPAAQLTLRPGPPRMIPWR